jgi:hypothetical protein
MNPRELLLAVLRRDDLSARQLVKDAAREGFSWTDAPAPDFRGPRARAVYAGVVELLAARKGQRPPSWTASVGPAPAAVYLVTGARKSPSMRRMVEQDSPAPLKRRNVLAPGQYLDVL